MSPEKLAYMANQIGKFFAHQGSDKAVASIADHLRKFWSPSMRDAAIGHLKGGTPGFDPLVRRAVESLRSL
jgi:formate dehydrogenase subunit delta